ncbi:MAG: aminoacyl-tRNA hydrolase [Parvibaculales bacterium]
MLLFVGLGNPGSKYAGNRHNIGFMAIDRIAEHHRFPPFKKKFQGQLTEAVMDGEKVLLLKPETFMNDSGKSVAEAVRLYKLPLGNIVVFYDELDLVPGKLRMKTGGGLAGHNGLRSLKAHIGADFRRARLGIGHPGHKDKVLGHVLKDFSIADGKWLSPFLDAVAGHAGLLVKNADATYQNRVHEDMAAVLSPPGASTGKTPTQE